MSIASGFTKMKNYILTSSGYKLLSRWTSSQTVHMGDGTDDTDTVEYRFGAIKGITTSTNVSETGYAADAKTVSEINQSLTLKNQIKIKTITKVITSSSGNINTGIPSTNNVLIARSAWDDNAAFIITPFASPQNQTWFLNCKDSSGNIYSNQPIGVIIYYY